MDRQTVQPDKGPLFDGDPKSAAGERPVTLPAFLVPELRKHLAAYVAADEDAWIFLGPKGGRPKRDNFHAIWHKARKAAGIPDLHLHDLRHTGNTMAAETGATLRELMDRMGHGSTRAALIYLHAREEGGKTIAAGIDPMVSEITNKISKKAEKNGLAKGTADQKGHAGGTTSNRREVDRPRETPRDPPEVIFDARNAR